MATCSETKIKVNILSGKYIDKNSKHTELTLPFEPSDFQKYGFNCVENEENILVTAHTASGKTLIAEYAVAHYLRKGKRVIYTSPIKALSNEKYKDLKDKFEIQFKKDTGITATVGIITGDNKINPNGNVLIMTTEILRNMLYKLKSDTDKYKKEINSNEQIRLDDVGCVVIDEIHFILDPSRGAIFEEIIVMLDPNIELIMLSATIDKAQDFALWVSTTKNKPVNLITTSKRIVPLNHYIFVHDKIYNIMDSDNNFKSDTYDTCLIDYKKYMKDKSKKHKDLSNLNMITDTIRFLKKKNMLQAIFFSFSRNNCEKYAGIPFDELVDFKERTEIEMIFNKYMHSYEKQYEHLEQFHTIKKLMLKGVCFHHSGLLPIFKEVIEIIFHKGLIKVLFATETFAVGVNMPTRTVIFTELSKHTEDGIRNLNTGEYKQMAGRAGRRGIDTEGHVILLPLYEFPEKQPLRNILQGKVPYIQSKFNINYSFFLKIIQSDNMNMSKFLEGSLFQKENNDMIKQQIKDSEILDSEIKKICLNIDKNTEEKFETLYKYENIATTSKESNDQFTMKLSKNQTKNQQKLRAELKEIKNFQQLYKIYCEYQDKLLKLSNIKKSIEWSNNYIDYRASQIVQVLIDCEYIKNLDKPSNKFTHEDVTIRGILAAQINECNAMLLTEMIIGKMFHGLTPAEIVGILAIFIDDLKVEDRISRQNVTGTKLIHDRLDKIENLITEFKNVEYQNEIENDDYWVICYDYIDPAYLWTTGEHFSNVIKYIDTYEGNFVRNMLKINNIVHDLACLCQIYGDLELLPVLEKIDGLIIRDVVTVNSLYLS